MASPKNERKTEAFVREALRKHGYFEEGNGIIVEEQSSDMPRLGNYWSTPPSRRMGLVSLSS